VSVEEQRWIVWTRRVLVAVGAAAVVYAVIGLPAHLTLAREQRNYLRLLAETFLACMILLLPAVFGVGYLLGRFVPPPVRAVVQGTLFVSLIVVVTALPALLGNGHSSDLPSALPRDYAHGLALVLGLVWLTALVLIAVRIARRRRGRETPS
jgi:hypothetical protein